MRWLSSYAGAGGGASGQRPPACSSSATRSRASTAFAAPNRACSRRRASSCVEALGRPCSPATTRGATRRAVIDAVNAVFEPAAAEASSSGFRPHTHRARRRPGAASGAAARRRGRAEPATAACDRRDWRDSLTSRAIEPEEVLREQEARRVAAAVRASVARGMPAGDVIVLARRRESLACRRCAAARALPFVAAEDSALPMRSRRSDLVAVLDVLVSPRQRSVVGACAEEPAVRRQRRRAGGARGGAPRMRRAGGTAAAAPGSRAAALAARARAARAVGRRCARACRRTTCSIAWCTRATAWRALAAARAARAAAGRAGRDRCAARPVTVARRRRAMPAPYGFVRALQQRALKVKAPAPRRRGAAADGARRQRSRSALRVACRRRPARPQQRRACALLVDWPVERERRAAARSSDIESRCPPSLQRSARAGAGGGAARRAERALRRDDAGRAHAGVQRAPSRAATAARAGGRACSRRSEACAADAPTTAAAPRRAERRSCCRAAAVRRACRPRRRRAGRRADDAAAASAARCTACWSGPAAAAVPRLDGLAAAAARRVRLPRRGARCGATRARSWHSPTLRAFLRRPAVALERQRGPVSDGGELLRLDRLVRSTRPDGAHWWVLDYKLPLDAAGDCHATPAAAALSRRRAVVATGDAVRCRVHHWRRRVHRIQAEPPQLHNGRRLPAAWPSAAAALEPIAPDRHCRRRPRSIGHVRARPSRCRLRRLRHRPSGRRRGIAGVRPLRAAAAAGQECQTLVWLATTRASMPSVCW